MHTVCICAEGRLPGPQSPLSRLPGEPVGRDAHLNGGLVQGLPALPRVHARMCVGTVWERKRWPECCSPRAHVFAVPCAVAPTLCVPPAAKDFRSSLTPRLSPLAAPSASVLVLDGESLTAEGLMRIHAELGSECRPPLPPSSPFALPASVPSSLLSVVCALYRRLCVLVREAANFPF